jgi:hypothetical protein
MVTISAPGLFWGPYVGFLHVHSACIGHCSYVYDWWEDISCQICVEDSGDGLSFGFCLSSLSYCHIPDQEARVHSLGVGEIEDISRKHVRRGTDDEDSAPC